MIIETRYRDSEREVNDMIRCSELLDSNDRWNLDTEMNVQFLHAQVYFKMKMIEVSVKYGDYAVVRFHDNYIALHETEKEYNL